MGGVQQLDPNYIKKLDSRQLYSLEEQGIIKKQGGKYYVAGNNVSRFEESCFVKDGDNVKTFKINRKGTIVERTTPQSSGKPVGEPVSTYSVSSSMIIERMGLTDENLKTAFLSFLSNKEGLTLDKSGNITFDKANATALNDALKEFANLHKENFVNPNADKYIEFTQDSAPEIIDELQQGDAIGEAVESDGRTRYSVKNEGALESTLSERVGDISYENSSSRSATVGAVLTTTTTTEEGIVDVPDNLRDSRSARRQLRKDAADSYADMVANADDYQRDAIDLYIAERKYNKKIDKKMEDMLIYKTNIGGKKDKKIQRDDADIIQMYINKYAKEEDRTKLNSLVEQRQNSNNPEDQQAILNALKSSNVVGIPDKFEDLSPDLKRKGALICMAKANGYEPKAMLRLMAAYEVMMKERTSNKVIADDKWFIKEQSKDFVKNQQAQQDVLDTEVHFSRKSRRHAQEDGKPHTDIGKKGRALVKACPEMLCDEITNPSQFKENEDEGIFKAEMKDGTIKYFKFSPEKWKTFMGICCDPSNATDDAMKVLFGNNEAAKKNFLDDMNMTLQEGRSILTMNLPSPYGETGTLKFENIVGNTNNKVGNRELNTLRDMVESAGYSIDKNTTTGKRMLHVLKNAGLGAGMGFLTGGMGSLLAGAVNVAGTLSGAVDWSSSGTIYDTDRFTSETYENGRLIDSQTTEVVEEHKWSDSGSKEYNDNYRDSGNNHLRTATNAGILGGIAGTVRGIATSGRVQERGRNTDDVFNLTRQVQTTDETEETFSLEIPQFTTVETRSGTKEIGQEIPKLKAVRYRGPEAYSGLYKYEDGSPVSPRDFAKAYQAQIGGIMTDYNFFVYPELTVPGKGKIVPVEDYEAEYKKITPGTSGGARGVVINPQGKKTVKAQGTIRA